MQDTKGHRGCLCKQHKYGFGLEDNGNKIFLTSMDYRLRCRLVSNPIDRIVKMNVLTALVEH